MLIIILQGSSVAITVFYPIEIARVRVQGIQFYIIHILVLSRFSSHLF